MNRKQGQSQRMQGQHSSFRGNRAGQTNQAYQYDKGYGRAARDDDFDLSGSRPQRGMNSFDDTYETRGGYRDTDYDLDGATYASPRMSTQQDEDRFANRSSYDSSFGRYAGSQGDRGLNRQGSSSERFGYPSNMNAWSGADRSYNSGRTSGRNGQSGWSGQDSDMGQYDSNFDSTVGNNWEASQSYTSNRPATSSAGSLSERGHFGKGPKGYKRSDDRIKEEVCETLSRSPRIDASDIEVSVDDAIVTLSGTVDSKDIRRAAEMAIENLSGVDDVKNEIRVKKSDSMSMSDSSTSNSNFVSPSGTKSKTDSSSSKGSSRL